MQSNPSRETPVSHASPSEYLRRNISVGPSVKMHRQISAVELLNNRCSRQKLTEVSPRSHSSNVMGKRKAQKDTIIDITSDFQVNCNFPYRWSPASLTFNIYFYLFLYLHIRRITTNNNTPHLKSPKTKTEEPPSYGQQ